MLWRIFELFESFGRARPSTPTSPFFSWIFGFCGFSKHFQILGESISSNSHINCQAFSFTVA